MNCEIKLFLFRWVFDKNLLKFLFKFLKSWLVIYIYKKSVCIKQNYFTCLKRGKGKKEEKKIVS